MQGEKKKINIGSRGMTNYIPEYDQQAYNYWRTASAYEALALFFENLSEPKKVANTVGTFLNGDSNGSQVSTTKTEFGKGRHYGDYLFDRGQQWFPSINHENGIGKGRHYGDYLFDRGQQWFPDYQSND